MRMARVFPSAQKESYVSRGRPGVSVGYFRLPEQTLSKFRNGWVHTGDIAVMDEDGYITIVGTEIGNHHPWWIEYYSS